MGSEAKQGFLVLGSDEWIGKILISHLNNLNEEYFIFHSDFRDKNSIQKAIQYYRPAYVVDCRETDLACLPQGNNSDFRTKNSELLSLVKICSIEKVHPVKIFVNCFEADIHPLALIIRFSFPLHYDLSRENFLSHLHVPDKEERYSISILPDLIPECLRMIKEEICGDFCLVHPEKISIEKINKIYRKVVNGKDFFSSSSIEESLSKVFKLHLAELERNQLLEM